jgi:CheY-like chemotaxis protein
MAKSPDDRFADMLQMAAAVERLLAGSARHTGAADSARKTFPVAPSVLIVEPSKLQARIVKDAFAKAGARSVDVVGSAQVALQGIGKAVPDVIVASRQLRDMPGNDFFNRLDSMTELQDALFVSVTASDDSAAIVTPGARLAHAHVEKQAGVNDILRAIHVATRFHLGQVDFAAAAKKTGTRLLIASGDGRISRLLRTGHPQDRAAGCVVVSSTDGGNLPQQDASLVLVLTGADNR